MTNDVKISQAPSVTAPKSAKRKKIASLDRRKARSGWLFILPFLIGFALIYVPLLMESLQLAFGLRDDRAGTMTFVGFDNFVGVFTKYSDPMTSQTFPQVLVEGLGALAFELPAILLFSLFMAVMLNQKMAGRAFFRAIFFIPVIISTGIMQTVLAAPEISSDAAQEGIDTGEQEESGGLIEATDLQWLFANMSVGQELVTYVTGLVNNIFNIINRSGVQMLIFLAALQSISPAIYESCKIDGATGWETFWKVTFPMISPMILVNAIYTVIDSFTISTNPVMEYITAASEVATDKIPGREYSTAMAWTYFLIVILIVALIAGVMSAFVFYQRKND